MNFYYPLTLGMRRIKPVTAEVKDNGSEPKRQRYEAWGEGPVRLEVQYEEHPEHFVLQKLQQSTRTQDRRFWLILGEPGAGKSTLLEAWFTRWAAQLAAPHLGLSIPVLARLRNLEQEDSKQDSATLAERLWNWGKESKGLLATTDVEPIYSKDRGQMFFPIWLLDGLDEVPPQLLDKGLYERLVNLPGLKVITCRTAVYQQSLRQKADRYKAREYEILRLKPHEQQTFLEKALADNTSRAQALHKSIQQNIQIRLLAANPLMLGLIAEVSGEIELPSSRAEFYRLAIAEMWNRKPTLLPEAPYMTDQRDHALTDLAQEMRLEQIEAPLSQLMQAAQKAESTHPRLLIKGLKRAGIVRINPRLERFGFVHLTFQEFYLARALQPSGLQPALERFWGEARYEETLGLLIALLSQDGQHGGIAQGIQWLVEWGERIHRKDPHILWRKRRSPLRVALHLLYRAGIALEELAQTRIYIWEKVNRSVIRKLAVAWDAYTPTTTLATLAHDQNQDVRRRVAQNTNTLPEILTALAHDQDQYVREGVAKNANTPPETLAALAHDQDTYMRWFVTANSNTPPETLAALIHDQDNFMRGIAVRNANLPPETLAALAHDQNQSISVAANTNTPPETLATLAHDQGRYVRMRVAENAITLPETLIALAHDQDGDVRLSVARNANTPPETLAILAHDQDGDVRRWIATNANLAPETLATLTHDQDQGMRRWVAANANLAPETLAALAHDQHKDVRLSVARNANTLPETLTALAHDQDQYVREGVAENAHTPPEALAALAHDQNQGVRRYVAANANTLLEDL